MLYGPNRQEDGKAMNRFFLTVFVIVFLLAWVRADGWLGNLLQSQTKTEVIEINKELNKEIEKVITINNENEEKRVIIEQAKEEAKEVIKETAKQKEVIKEDTVKKKKEIKEKVTKVENKQASQADKDKEIVAILADSIWDDFCEDNSTANQCLNDTVG